MGKSYVSVEIVQCLTCCESRDKGIILDTRLKSSLEAKTLTGYETCDTCQARMDEGYVALIAANNPQVDSRDHITDPSKANTTGEVIWVPTEYFQQIFDVQVPDEKLAFVEAEVTRLIVESNEDIVKYV